MIVHCGFTNGKKLYRDVTEACVDALTASISCGRPISPYLCKHCGGMHLTRKVWGLDVVRLHEEVFA